MTTEEKIKVMQAYANGSYIGIPTKGEGRYSWYCVDGCSEIEWDWVNFDYIVKEEPKYIPYSYEDDLLGMKVESKEVSERFLVTYQDNEKVWIEGSFCTYQELLDRYKKIDGTPCGKLSE